jgi:hypothetical protein
MAGDPLDQAWIDSLVGASEAVEPAVTRSAVVGFTIGKTKGATIRIVDGRVAGPADGVEPDVSIPVTAEQLAGFEAGTESMAKSFMRGDLKPVGSTGALLAVLALFDDPDFHRALSRPG